MVVTIFIEEPEGMIEVDLGVTDDPHKSPIECLCARRNGELVEPPSQKRIYEALLMKANIE